MNHGRDAGAVELGNESLRYSRRLKSSGAPRSRCSVLLSSRRSRSLTIRFCEGCFFQGVSGVFGIYEMPLIACNHMADWKQFRFPRSKKRRIKKKWRKQSRNFRMVPQKKIFRVGNSFYAHPKIVDEFWKQMKAKASAVNSAFWNGHVPEIFFGNIGETSRKQGK